MKFKQLGHYLNFNALVIKNVHVILTDKDEVIKKTEFCGI